MNLSFFDVSAIPSQKAVIAGAVFAACVITGGILRAVFSKASASGGASGIDIFGTEPTAKNSRESAAESVGAGTASAADGLLEAQKESQKAAVKEDLTPLFEMEQAQTQAKARINAEKEAVLKPAALKNSKEPPREIQAQLDSLISEINALTSKGLSDSQTAQNLLSRARDTPAHELAPLIDAMLLFVRTESTAGRESAVIGQDARFEQKAALSALAKGKPELAVTFLNNCAEDALNDIKVACGTHEKSVLMQEIGGFYRAAAAVQRPFDLQESWNFLVKSAQYDADNAVTQMMQARACYEGGQTKKACGLFEKLTRADAVPDYAADYAGKMIPQIAAERAAVHAQRIKKNYDDRDAASGQRAKTAMRASDLARQIQEDDNEMLRV